MALEVKGSHRVKTIREALEQAGYYDPSRRIVQLSRDTFALPLNDSCLVEFERCSKHDQPLPPPFHSEYISLSTSAVLPASKLATAKRNQDHRLLQDAVAKLIKDDPNTAELDHQKLLCEVPKKWERHGDMIVLPQSSFSHTYWKLLGVRLWNVVATSLRCERLAKDETVKSDDFRSSSATLLTGSDAWVEHIDHGVKYVFDVTKCIFSSGNISEKIRVASFDCSGETVVDLYAGIGYFTLPYLVHTGADRVHACEWNSQAVEALRRGLAANKVEGRCTIHFGDCRKVPLKCVADRVNAGLLPSSEGGWSTACTVLREQGGWLHIHGNVCSKPGGRGRELNPWEDRESNEGNGDRFCSETCSETSLCSREVSSKCSVAELSQDEQSGFNAVKRSSLRRQKWAEWSEYTRGQIAEHLSVLNRLERGREWHVCVRHIEHVKSYAPHIDHIVVDIECRPIECDH